MPIYKYVSPDNLYRYLENWHLRLTPPAAFNDPFDVSPVFPVDTWMPSGQAADKSAVRSEMKRAFRAGDMGVLCLTRTRTHPLMWAHYADGHRGALLEFDETHPCFNRRPSTTSVQGQLMPVLYADERPKAENFSLSSMAALHTTKSLDWAYEQEVRLLWQLSKADVQPDLSDSAGHPIRLYAVPVEALRCIVLGCNSDQALLAKVTATLSAGSAEHVDLKLAKTSNADYRLHYIPASAGLSWARTDIE